jgi:hypothetical protein
MSPPRPTQQAPGTRTVYGLFDPRTEELKYVGITQFSLRGRLGSHYKQAREPGRPDRQPVLAWVLEMASANVRIEIRPLRENAEYEDEAAEIAAQRKNGVALLNVSSGGRSGHAGVPMSEANRRAVSERQRGKKRPPESTAKTAAALRGRPRPAEVRAKISASRRGRRLSPEAKAKRSARMEEKRKVSPQ